MELKRFFYSIIEYPLIYERRRNIIRDPSFLLKMISGHIACSFIFEKNSLKLRTIRYSKKYYRDNFNECIHIINYFEQLLNNIIESYYLTSLTF